eukprot:15442640-Alexandrium_andersonii.AAC.1
MTRTASAGSSRRGASRCGRGLAGISRARSAQEHLRKEHRARRGSWALRGLPQDRRAQHADSCKGA